MSRSPRSAFRKFPLRSASPEDRSSPSPLATAARLRRRRPRTHPTASAPCGFALALLPRLACVRPQRLLRKGGVRAPARGGPRASCGRSNGVSESCSRSTGRVKPTRSAVPWRGRSVRGVTAELVPRHVPSRRLSSTPQP
ncbi:hypothetical protein MRX96_052422 [Rhipicephalus microplus]